MGSSVILGHVHPPSRAHTSTAVQSSAVAQKHAVLLPAWILSANIRAHTVCKETLRLESHSFPTLPSCNFMSLL